MFCYQCEQTSKGTGCTRRSAFAARTRRPPPCRTCWSTPPRDFDVRPPGGPTRRPRRAGRSCHARRPVRHGDQRRFRPGPARRAPGPGRGRPRQGPRHSTKRPASRRARRRRSSPAPPPGSRPPTCAGLVRQGEEVAIPKFQATLGHRHRRPAGTDPLRTERGRRLRRSRPGAGPRRPGLYATFHEALDFLTRREPRPSTTLLGWVLKAGEVNLKVMELLDAANTEHLRPSRADARSASRRSRARHPRLRPRPEGPRRAAQADRGQGHQRLHARRDAALPRLSGPEEVQAPGGQLRRGLAGPGGKEFDAFPGAILMTTNCIQKPQGQLQGPHLHQRAGRLAGRAAHRAATATSRR